MWLSPFLITLFSLIALNSCIAFFTVTFALILVPTLIFLVLPLLPLTLILITIFHLILQTIRKLLIIPSISIFSALPLFLWGHIIIRIIFLFLMILILFIIKIVMWHICIFLFHFVQVLDPFCELLYHAPSQHWSVFRCK